MLQNPQFANIISNQLKLQKSREKSGNSADGGDDLSNLAGSVGDSADPSVDSSALLLSNGGAQLDPKQAQDLLQLLNLIQSMGGVDKIAPLFASSATQSLGPSSELGSSESPSEQTGSRQRRPQTFGGGGETGGAEPASESPPNPFVFSYAQPDQDQRQAAAAVGSASDSDQAGSLQPQLTPEIIQNLAQLESLFAYKQPSSAGRQSLDQNQNQNQNSPLLNLNVESQPFTAEDAKQFQPLLSRQQQQQQPQAQTSLIRVQVPNSQEQRGRQRGQQAPASVRGQQAPIATSVNEFTSFLPYLEGDLRQPVGSRLSGGGGGQQTQLQRNQQQMNRNAGATRAGASSSRSQQFVNSGEQIWRQPQPQQPQMRRQQQQQPQQQPQQLQQQARRRPPNRERTQRLNTIDFPAQAAPAAPETSRARSLVLMTSGPPIESIQPGGDATAEETLSDRALEERLRLLENGFISPSPPSAADVGQPTARSQQQFGGGGGGPRDFFQPTLSSTNVFASSASSLNSNGGESRDAEFGRDSADGRTTNQPASEQEDPSSSSSSSAGPETPATQEQPSLNTLVGPLISGDQSGPGASLDPQTGKLVCNRRGVFAHPNSCGRFIVCAPQSRSHRALRAFEHHCPAEHIFHVSRTQIIQFARFRKRFQRGRKLTSSPFHSRFNSIRPIRTPGDDADRKACRPT